jgi:hypothetical protein
MARRGRAGDKALAFLIVVALIVGVPIYIDMMVGDAVGWPVLIGGAVVLVISYAWFQAARASAKEKARLAEIEGRRQQLLAKYGDDQIVARIMGREVRQGQSDEQLRDALGAPVDTDKKVMKKHRREVWKYHRTGVNRFGLRVTLEDGIVVGWDQKM